MIAKRKTSSNQIKEEIKFPRGIENSLKDLWDEENLENINSKLKLRNQK